MKNNLETFEREAHDLLIGNEFLNNNKEAYEKLHRYLKGCNPHALVSPFDKVFEICIEYFKPGELFIKMLPLEKQKELVLWLVDHKDDKDAVREKLEGIMDELGKNKVVTKENLVAARAKIEEHNGNYEIFKKKKDEGVEVASNVVKNPDYDKDNPQLHKEYLLVYTISDDFLGEPKREIKKIIETDSSQDASEAMRNGIKHNYAINERQGLLEQHKIELVKDFRATNRRLDDIESSEVFTNNCIGNHDNMIAAIDAVDDNKKGYAINNIRTDIRNLHQQKTPIILGSERTS